MPSLQYGRELVRALRRERSGDSAAGEAALGREVEHVRAGSSVHQAEQVARRWQPTSRSSRRHPGQASLSACITNSLMSPAFVTGVAAGVR